MMQVQLDQHRFFSKPKVALDSVGGESGVRLVEALSQVGGVRGVAAGGSGTEECMRSCLSAGGMPQRNPPSLVLPL